MGIFKLHKQLVYKVPLDITIIEDDRNSQYTVRPITLEDIENDEWLREDKKSLVWLINSGHLGVVILDEEKHRVAGRVFIAVESKRPSHIPKIPKHTAWLHYGAVKPEYQGHGLQKKLMLYSIQLAREKYGDIDIYGDTQENNIPSRINQKRIGMVEAGIYTVLEIGYCQFPFCHFQFGFWNKKIKHQELLHI